jgi:hypothetical protein
VEAYRSFRSTCWPARRAAARPRWRTRSCSRWPTRSGARCSSPCWQQFPFFDVSKINESIKFVNLAADLLEGDFTRVLARIDEEVQAFAPSLVFVDSFRSVVQSAKTMDSGAGGLQHFVQQLGMQMTSWLATTFLIGEYLAPEAESSPVFTVADGIVWLSQLIHRDALVRQIQVAKKSGSPTTSACRWAYRNWTR